MAAVISIIVSALLWLAALLCLPSAIRGRRRVLFWFLVSFALTMSLQPVPVYAVVDAVIGGVNITYFLFHATAIISVALLNALVQTATSAQPITRRSKLVAVAFSVAIILLQAVLFFGSDWRLSHDIHHAFFDRWDYTLYAATTWVALAYFAVAVAVACLADMRRQRRRVTRVSLAFVAFGCLGVLVYSVVSLTNAVMANLNHDADFTNWSRTIYYGALATAPVSLAIGLGLTAVADGIAAARRSIWDRILLWRLSPLWERLLASSPELSLDDSESRIGVVFARGVEARLYRRYVEVRDSLLLYPREISPSDLALLEATERHTSPSGLGRRFTGGTGAAGDEPLQRLDSPRVKN